MVAVPGQRGHMPKREAERRRTNKVDITTVVLDDVVEVPPLLIEDCPQLVVDFYNSLAKSGQARFYEPSDWQRARLLCWSLAYMIREGKPTAMLYAALQKDFESLLVAEGDRRRCRMEIDRLNYLDKSAEVAKAAQMARYRKIAS